MTCTMDNKRINLYSSIVALLLVHIAVAQGCDPPCQNGGVCEGTRCQCDGTGYAGMLCEFIISDTCDPNPCMNGGTCTLSSATKGYTCNCQGTGYTGGACERVSDGSGCTNSDNCNNGGVCNNGMCDCTGTDYFGANCEHKKAVIGFEETLYSFSEGTNDAKVFLTRTETMVIQTEVLITARPTGFAGDATLDTDYRFNPNPMTETFDSNDDRRRVDFEILNDGISEGDERFELEITIAQSNQNYAQVDYQRNVATIRIKASDGGAPSFPGCTDPSYSCKNMGTCEADGTCSCTTGWTGDRCEAPALCSTSDAAPECNGAICIDNTCDCTSIGDYFGDNCQNKKAIVGFESTAYSFGEGDGGEVVYVTREFGIDFETTIEVRATPLGETEDGVDYSFVPNPMTVTFPAGDDIKKPVNFEILNDDILEGDELFELQIQVLDKDTTRVAGSMRLTTITIRASDGGVSESQDCNLGGTSSCLNMGTCNPDGTCTCTDAWMGNRCELPVPPDNGGGEPSPQGGLSSTAIIAIAVVVIVVILVIVIVIVVVYCKRRDQNKDDYSSGQRGELEDGRGGGHKGGHGGRHGGGHGGGHGKQKANTYAAGAQFRNQPRGGKRHATVYDKSERKIGAEFPREKLKLHEHLGSGAFANVVRAEAMGIVKRGVKTVVAVKMLKEGATESDRSDFSKELKVYRMLEPNPNIIVMLGCCTDKDPFYLIMEYAPNGNLQSHLRGIRNAPESPYNNINATVKNFLAPGEVLDFASQIANGMKYLASKQCIHRDLATRNVLLGDGLVCKLSDFGLARDISEQNSYEMKSRGRVPVRWMAPESLLENTYTSKSDVWSFAVTMWELLTVGSHPYPGKSSKRVIEDLQKGYRLPKPEHCSDEIYAMMMECWNKRPEKRPSFSQVHRKLENMMEDAQGYLVMTDFNASDYVYLDHDHQSDSSVENEVHGDAAGAV